MDDTTLVLERLIDAPPEKVFAAWTDRSAMEEWYRDGDGWIARVTDLDVRVGGTYRVEFGPAGETPFIEFGTYLEIDPPQRLVMTENLEGVPTPWANTTVTVELFEESGKTRCVLTHTGFPTKEHRDNAQSGWPGFLDRLERVATAR